MPAMRCVCGYVHYPSRSSDSTIDNTKEEWNQPFKKGAFRVHIEGSSDGLEAVTDVYACPKCKTLRIE